jgi:hypothetical protein
MDISGMQAQADDFQMTGIQDLFHDDPLQSKLCWVQADAEHLFVKALQSFAEIVACAG